MTDDRRSMSQVTAPAIYQADLRPRVAVADIPPDYNAPRAIRVVRTGEDPFELPIYPHAHYTFGRDHSCTVVISDSTVSRDHGLLSCGIDGCWVYRDKGSSNGSFLADRLESDEPIEEARRLSADRSYRVAAGQSILLGNRAGRICFLKDAPRPAAEQSARSPAAVRLEQEITRNARHRMPLFLLGPTGSGKTHAARRIHELSEVKGHFVLVDCGSLPKDLNSLRSELLGHVKGAFSDAREPRLGKLPHADGGTLFLDEVESLSPEGQGLLLNLIDGTGDFKPLGQAADVDAKRPQFRLISASKIQLFRSGLRTDLCNRLGVGGIILLPTLDDRRADIPSMVAQMVAVLNKELQLDARFEPAAVTLLQSAAWPGHVRELEGVVRTVVELKCADQSTEPTAHQTIEFKVVEGKMVVPLVITVAALRDHLEHRKLAFGAPVESGPATPPGELTNALSPTAMAPPRKRPRDYSADDIRSALKGAGSNVTHAARALGVAPNTLKKLMDAHGIARPG